MGFVSRLLPHDTKQTTCPPASLVGGSGPLIIVPSLMRSGTHLLLDSLFNNFPELRRKPLFVDFDAYERAGLPVAAFKDVTGVVIKTHFPQTPLGKEYELALASLAARAVIVKPVRDEKQVLKSLEKWGMVYSAEEFSAIVWRCEKFWAPFHQLTVDFSALLDPVKLRQTMIEVGKRTGLQLRDAQKLSMPAQSRAGVYVDKILTRMFGGKVPRVNTTIGYRLRPKSLK